MRVIPYRADVVNAAARAARVRDEHEAQTARANPPCTSAARSAVGSSGATIAPRSGISNRSERPFGGWLDRRSRAIVSAGRATADLAALVHGGFAALFALVLVAHVGARLRHHYVKRDTVLTRMLPGKRLEENPFPPLACGCSLPAPHPRRTGKWIPPEQARVRRHLREDRGCGRIQGVRARLRFDPDKARGSRSDVTVKVTSADMNART